MPRHIDADALEEHKFVGNKFVINDYQQGWNDAIDAIIDNAPTVDMAFDPQYKADLQGAYDCGKYSRPKGEWIKVEDALPSDSNIGCLVTVFETNPFTQEDFETVLPYFVGYDGETWNTCNGDVIPFEVIAWMRVPEPYEQRGDV